jgi:hypothetical protein
MPSLTPDGLLDLMLDRGEMKGRQVLLLIKGAIVHLQAVQTGLAR